MSRLIKSCSICIVQCGVNYCYWKLFIALIYLDKNVLLVLLCTQQFFDFSRNKQNRVGLRGNIASLKKLEVGRLSPPHPATPKVHVKPRSSLDHASARNYAAVVTATQSHATRIIELLVCWLHWNIRLRAVSDVEFGGTK